MENTCIIEENEYILPVSVIYRPTNTRKYSCFYDSSREYIFQDYRNGESALKREYEK